MLLYYVRHGDPIYDPNQLTPLGQRQAEAAARRLAVHGINQIYSSPSNRARQTAEPLCQIMKLEPQILPWTDEDLLYRDLSMPLESGGRTWVFRHPQGHARLISREIQAMGRDWYKHPAFTDTAFGDSMERIQREADAWLEALGYRHDLRSNCYHRLRDNRQRVALYAHEGVGVAFLSCVLDIPYPMLATHFDMTHSGVSVIYFPEEGNTVVPKLLTYSNDSHLYKDGLPTKHQNLIYY